jgi:hypothetical protein
VLAFGRGKRVPVIVTIDGDYTYRTTIGVMDGRHLTPLTAQTTPRPHADHAVLVKGKRSSAATSTGSTEHQDPGADAFLSSGGADLGILENEEPIAHGRDAAAVGVVVVHANHATSVLPSSSLSYSDPNR